MLDPKDLTDEQKALFDDVLAAADMAGVNPHLTLFRAHANPADRDAVSDAILTAELTAARDQLTKLVAPRRDDQ